VYRWAFGGQRGGGAAGAAVDVRTLQHTGVHRSCRPIHRHTGGHREGGEARLHKLPESSLKVRSYRGRG
jgi:hypothetical protein